MVVESGDSACNLGDSCRWDSSNVVRVGRSYSAISVRSVGNAGQRTSLGRGAVLADVARLAALVAGLARGVERAAIGSGAIAGDVALIYVNSSPGHSPGG